MTNEEKKELLREIKNDTSSGKLIATLKLIEKDLMNINVSVNQLFGVMTKYYMKRFIQYYQKM
jgi:wobble nucleotide-excising tRNase